MGVDMTIYEMLIFILLSTINNSYMQPIKVEEDKEEEDE